MKSQRRRLRLPAADARIIAQMLLAAAFAPIAILSAKVVSGQAVSPTADVLIGTPTVRVTSTAGVSVGIFVGGVGRHAPIAEGEASRVGDAAIDVVVRGADGAVHPIRAGERLTITVDGRSIAAGVAPDASARVVPADDTVVGTIDRSGRYIARARRPDGTAATSSFNVAEAGVFTLDMTDVIDLRPETPVEIVAKSAVMAFRSRALAERVTATLGADRLSGLSPPGATVAGTVRDESGRSVADASGNADALGRFELSLRRRDGERFRLRAGDDLLIAWLGRAEPLSFVIPSLVVDVDPERGRISGSALADWHVEVGIRSAEGWTPWHIPTDASGRFALSPPEGIEAGDSGFVAMDLSERAKVALPWVVPDIEVELGGSDVAGAGIGGQRIEAELVRQGFTIGQAQSAVPPTAGFAVAGCARCDWLLDLRDAFGLPVPILAGDLLRVGVDSGWTEVETPPLIVDANPETNGIRGVTAPGRTVRLKLGAPEAPRAEIELVSAMDGTFAGVFAGEEISAGDHVDAAVKLGGVTFLEHDSAWRLSLDIVLGIVKGHARPGERIVAALDSEDDLRGFAEGAADLSGAFELTLRSREGSAVRLLPGNRLRIESAGRELSVTIPSISVDADPMRDLVFGEAPREGEVSVTAIDERGLGGGRIEASVERTGTPEYETAVGERFDVSGGDIVQARYTSPDGDRFEIGHRMPLLAVQSRGHSISGFAGPGVNVHIGAEREGISVASAVSMADSDGRFAIVLPESSSYRLASGDTVRAEWSSESSGVTEMALTVVAPISTTISAATRSVFGRAVPGAPVVVTVQEPGVERWTPIGAPAASDGSFAVQLPGIGALPAGTIVDASADDPRGHRTWVRATIARLEIEIAAGIVRGIAAPLEAYALKLSNSGEEIARSSTRTDTLGGFETVLLSDDPATGINLPGQTLSLHPAGDPFAASVAALLIPPLSIALDYEANLVHGVGPPHTTITVLLDSVGRPRTSINVSVGASGAWSVHESEFPGGIDIEALRRMTARTITRDGHFVSVSTEPRGFPTATSTVVPTSTPGGVTPPPTTSTPSPTVTAMTAVPTERATIYLPWSESDITETSDATELR